MTDSIVSWLADELEKQQGSTASGISVGELHRLFIERHAKPHLKTWGERERYFELYLTNLRDLDIAMVKRKDVIELQQNLASSYGKSASNKALEHLSSMFNKAIDWEIFDGYNPCFLVKGFRIPARDRFLSPAEVAAFLDSVSKLKDATARDCFHMLLWTAQRRSNVETMRWSDIDMERAVWRIPHTKNGTAHNVPLAKQAMEILERRKRFCQTDWVFPTEHDAAEPRRHYGKTWTIIRDRASLPGVRIHDLRRTHASWQVMRGVSLLTVGRTLNHKDPSSTAIYARLSVEPVRAAMQIAADNMANTGKRIRRKSPSKTRLNARLKPSESEESKIRAKILLKCAARPHLRNELRNYFGGLTLNKTEMGRILAELVNEKKLALVRCDNRWRYSAVDIQAG